MGLITKRNKRLSLASEVCACHDSPVLARSLCENALRAEGLLGRLFGQYNCDEQLGVV